MIVLTNRVHPDGRGDARPLREQVRALVASSAPARTETAIANQLPFTAAFITQVRRLPVARTNDGRVRTGIDVMRDAGFVPLAGLRVGLITNRSGFDSTGERTVDLLAHAPNVTLAAIFAPEHGLESDIDAPFADSRDAATGLPVHSLYEATSGIRRIAPQALAGVDALVFDLQD